MEKTMSTRNNIPTINDVIIPIEEFAVVQENVIFKEALEEMSYSNIGIVCIVDEKNNLLGIITDGDIRRKLLKVQKPFSAFLIDNALDHAALNPLTIYATTTLKEAVSLMEKKGIWDMPVINEDGKLIGLLHLHPVVKALLQL